MIDGNLKELLFRRDKEEFGSEGWGQLNLKKADYLENIKPSTGERIIYFNENDLGGIKGIFTRNADVFNLPFKVERRSILEYHPAQRHPISYVLVRFEDKYFFTLREQGGGEIRLIGKKGLIGGHVAEEDLVAGDLAATFYNALFREAKEEAGIGKDMVKSVELRGVIKSDLGVDADHLGLVYEMEISTGCIKSEEDGVMAGIWIPADDLPRHYESFENWSKIVYDNLLKK